MKKVLLLVIAITFMGVGNIAHGQDAYWSSLLLGKWACSFSFTENEGTVEEIHVAIETEEDYVRNGKSNSFGTITATVFDEITLEYLVAGTATWEISDGFLIETITDIKTTNVTPEITEQFAELFDINEFTPQEIAELQKITELLDLDKLIPEGISASTKIITISEKEFVGVSESDGEKYSCSRIKKK